MAAPTVAELREGLRARLDTIPNVQASAYMIANPSPPALEVVPDEIDYDLTMGRGGDTWRFIVRCYASAASDIGGQKRLDTLLAPAGASSVKAAVEADATLGGKAEDTRVVSATGYRIFQRAGGPELLGCEWTVEIIASGK